MTHLLPALEPRLFWLDPAALGSDAEAAARASSWLDEEERGRHARIVSDRQAMEFLAAHALLRASLSRFAPPGPAAWRFVRDEHGRPSLDPGHQCGWLRFSLAHTAGLVAVAVARDRAVGVDVEDCERSLDWRSVARTFFAPGETAGLEALGTEELRRERFFALWTLKEAWLKARGLGLALPLRGVAFSVDGASGGALLEPGAARVDGAPAWRFERFGPTTRHRVAACIETAAGDGESAWTAEGVTPAGLR